MCVDVHPVIVCSHDRKGVEKDVGIRNKQNNNNMSNNNPSVFVVILHAFWVV